MAQRQATRTCIPTEDGKRDFGALVSSKVGSKTSPAWNEADQKRATGHELYPANNCNIGGTARICIASFEMVT
jgi:hypothetical protein